MEDNTKFLTEADIKAIADLIQKYPNDQELGKKIREYYININNR